MTSKTIIISSQEDNHARGILTLFQEDELLKCRLRVYNVKKISKFCKFGIFHQNEVFSANLIERNGVFESSFVGSFDISKDFYIALIDTQNNNEVLLAGGTYQGFYFNDNSVFLDNEKFSNNIKNENLTVNNEELCNDCDKCVNCKYKEFFYSHTIEEASPKLKTEKIAEIKDEQECMKEQNSHEQMEKFLTCILPQFDTIFKQYPLNEELNIRITNGKFIKINENGEEYSLGTITENDEIIYICYAVKCEYNSNPPEELGKHYQWLPLDAEDPLSEGYFIVFQDAKDLKIVEL